jgi:hypothetical protein
VTLVTSGASAAFSQASVGTGLTVTITGLGLSGTAATNYTLTQPTATADITQAQLSISGLTVGNKVYDGTTTATITSFGTLMGVFPGDQVMLATAQASAAFAQANVGTGLTVTISGLSLSGPDAAKYTLSPPTPTANITPAPLTVTVNNQSRLVGTSNPTLTGTLRGVVGGDSITVSYATTANPSSAPGAYPITATLQDPINRLLNYTLTNTPGALAVTPLVIPPVSPPPPSAVVYYAVGAGAGSSQVTIFDAATGTAVNSFSAFPGFDGGVTVATVETNGTLEVFVGTATANSVVAAFNGLTGAFLFSVVAFPGFEGGVNVATGAVTGAGTPELIVGTASANSHVKVFDGATGGLLSSFFAFPGFSGGVTVGAGDLFHSGLANVLVGTATANSVVGVFDGRSGAQLTQFQALPGFQGGVSVSAADLLGTGVVSILVGAAGQVKALDGNGNVVLSFVPYPGDNGAVRVGSVVGANGRTELLTGAGPGADPHVEQVDGPSLALLASFEAFDPGFLGGVSLG